MIATILPGSADFHAVGYNEHKVYKGVATLLEMQNFGATGSLGTSDRQTAGAISPVLQFPEQPDSETAVPCSHFLQRS